MAAKALEKAGAAAGLKIKVETQGQNGIQNRITDLDVANAKLVILAHDIQVKDAHRFANANVIECSTKEAMKKPRIWSLYKTEVINHEKLSPRINKLVNAHY